MNAVGGTVVPEHHNRAVLKLEDLAIGGNAVGVLTDERARTPVSAVIAAALDVGLAAEIFDEHEGAVGQASDAAIGAAADEVLGAGVPFDSLGVHGNEAEAGEGEGDGGTHSV